MVTSDYILILLGGSVYALLTYMAVESYYKNHKLKAKIWRLKYDTATLKESVASEKIYTNKYHRLWCDAEDRIKALEEGKEVV